MTHTEEDLEKKTRRRTKKKHPKMRMSGKATREIPRLWQAKKPTSH